MGALLQEDQSRYRQMHEKMPAFQKYYRLSQECTFSLCNWYIGSCSGTHGNGHSWN